MTSVPRGVTAREFLRALSQDGYELDHTTGSHRIYMHPKSRRRVVVASHRSGDTFPIGTLKRMITDAGWDEKDLVRLRLI